jgi:hypothetical protein
MIKNNFEIKIVKYIITVATTSSTVAMDRCNKIIESS